MSLLNNWNGFFDITEIILFKKVEMGLLRIWNGSFWTVKIEKLKPGFWNNLNWPSKIIEIRHF